MTSDCQRCKAKLSDYIDFRLTEGERDQIKTHLVLCLDCRYSWKTLQRLPEAMKNLPSYTPMEDLYHEVLRKTGRSKKIGLTAGLVLFLFSSMHSAYGTPATPHAIPETLIIRSRADWDDFLVSTKPFGGIKTDGSQIDFEHFMVVAVFPTVRGLAVQINNIEFLDDKVVVDYQNYLPRGEFPGGKRPHRPYFQIIPRTDLPIEFRRIP